MNLNQNQLAIENIASDADISAMPQITFAGQTVLTTELVAKFFGCEPKIIQNNFARNQSRFEIVKHYFDVAGDPLKTFKSQYVELTHPLLEGKSIVGKNTPKLTLWTKRGTALLAKIVDTDQAWNVIDKLVDFYFDRFESKVENNKESHKNSDEKYIAPIGDALAVAKTTSELLRLSDTSNIQMIEKICKIYQVDSSFLPVYVEQNPTQSLTNLLKQFNIKKSAHEVNLLLEKFGIIEQKQRVSTKTPDRIKQFWIFTQKGLEFGINLASPKNQRETSPHYFIEKFKELSKLIATT